MEMSTLNEKDFFPRFSLFLSTFQIGTVTNLLLLLFLTSLGFLNADSFFLIPSNTRLTMSLKKYIVDLKKKCRNLECMELYIEDLTLFIVNRGHKTLGYTS